MEEELQISAIFLSSELWSGLYPPEKMAGVLSQLTVIRLYFFSDRDWFADGNSCCDIASFL